MKCERISGYKVENNILKVKQFFGQQVPITGVPKKTCCSYPKKTSFCQKRALWLHF